MCSRIDAAPVSPGSAVELSSDDGGHAEARAQVVVEPREPPGPRFSDADREIAGRIDLARHLPPTILVFERARLQQAVYELGDQERVAVGAGLDRRDKLGSRGIDRVRAESPEQLGDITSRQPPELEPQSVRPER
jgi:hypothetical protein